MFGSRYRNVASCVFFCKQKTAYEMRISDWSSDVCSSDLRSVDPGPCIAGEAHKAEADGPGIGEQGRDRGDDAFPVAQPHPPLGNRSEEHTSELQSLMRISYAVFCLKKKK